MKEKDKTPSIPPVSPAEFKTLRVAAGFKTQAAAARFFGTSWRAWAYWENGGRPVPTMLAVGLGLKKKLETYEKSGG